jgi:hypothetical protein
VGADGGRVSIAVFADDTVAVPVAVGFEDRVSRDILVVPGVVASERLSVPAPGWRTLRATLPPDELRLDDARSVVVRVAPPARVTWDPDERFVDAAMQVLVEAGRVAPGIGVRVGDLGPGASIVVPPEDPALLGALNRALAARGASWRYGELRGSPVSSDSNDLLPDPVRVFRRVALMPMGPGSDTLLTVGGEPWAVRSGNLVLLGSRLDPTWSELPIRAAFVPLLDALATRAVRGEPVLPEAPAGVPRVLPATVTAVASGTGVVPVEGGAPWAPPAPGVYWLLAGVDTIGALSATIDPRESSLGRATDTEIIAAWPGAVVAPIDDGAGPTFATGGRGDLRPLLLLLAMACVVGESLLAGRRARAG